MEDWVAQERAAAQHICVLLKNSDTPIDEICDLYDQYRQICQAVIFADFGQSEELQSRLWQAHQDGRHFFHKELLRFRNAGPQAVVSMRGLMKMYLGWIKSSTRFYRGYIHLLNSKCGGLPQLEAVAQQVKSNLPSESSQSLSSPELRALVLTSCHKTLIYLGDLSRYRANEQLDRNPDVGPAIGYYGLANTIAPSSGLGHHQQAVVALGQRSHLRALYHLYRAMLVKDPHPIAAKNLKLEFGKIDSAWDRKELVPTPMPNDPESPKHVLVGWFVRMHSLCAKGEVFSSHAELEREVMSHLARVLVADTPNLDTTLARMILTNMAASYNAAQRFQEDNSGTRQQAFYYFFRSNVVTYTNLLQLFYNDVRFYNDLRGCDPMKVDDENLTAKLTPLMQRVLPPLRMYSAWLTANIHLMHGLAAHEEVKDTIDAFWPAYARAVDIVADDDIFGVWALDDYESKYMLDEDAETLGFLPLQGETQTLWSKWRGKDGLLKPRFADAGVVRMSPDEEMVARVKGLLDDGSYLAHEQTNVVPIGIVGDRIYYGQALQDAIAAAEEAKRNPLPPPTKAQEKPAKPLSYAAAAANARNARNAPQKAAVNGDASSIASRTRQVQATRMVDSLVDDDEGKDPVTPPQQHAVHPAIVTNGELPINGLGHTEFKKVPSYQRNLPSWRPTQASKPNTAPTPPTIRTPRDSLTSNAVERFQAVSSLWNDTAAQPISTSPGFPSGLPTGTLSSPVQAVHHAHSRNNSATSIRSRTSAQNGGIADSWSSLEYAPRLQTPNGATVLAGLGGAATEGYAHFGASGVTSPLLFGAGGGIWSNNSDAYRNTNSPPNAQGASNGQGG